jgi:hypothetical protein
MIAATALAEQEKGGARVFEEVDIVPLSNRVQQSNANVQPSLAMISASFLSALSNKEKASFPV